MRRAARGRGRGEAAVSEVLGYVLMLFLSSALLILSLQAFLQARDNTTSLQAATEVRLIADRVAAGVLQAGVVANEMPNATFEALIQLPALGGRAYYVNASHDRVHVNTTDGAVRAETHTFSVEALGNLHLHGTVQGSQGYVKVAYSKAASGWRTIELKI